MNPFITGGSSTSTTPPVVIANPISTSSNTLGSGPVGAPSNPQIMMANPFLKPSTSTSNVMNPLNPLKITPIVMNTNVSPLSNNKNQSSGGGGGSMEIEPVANHHAYG